MSYLKNLTVLLLFFCSQLLLTVMVLLGKKFQIHGINHFRWSMENVSDFNNFNWNKNVEKISVSSNDVEFERMFFKSGESIKQKLEKIDESKMMVNWRIQTDIKFYP